MGQGDQQQEEWVSLSIASASQGNIALLSIVLSLRYRGWMILPRTSLHSLRQETGLSQVDLAYLLGGTTAGMVCRHEKGTRMPSLETALGYALVLGVDVQELFGDLEAKAGSRISRKASVLFSMSHKDPSDPAEILRRETLERLSALRGSISC